jgi:alkanesulfonate monooxygenase SsuD/methylene tetrahydromethanopterin reductase-like flavin-dependent oxidoreductase (luciferase family)
MELGVGMFGDNHYDLAGRPQPTGQRLQELIEEIKLMDEVGLDFYGIGEHHRPDYAVSVPEIILAAAAALCRSLVHLIQYGCIKVLPRLTSCLMAGLS